jgi:hypothetical protein
MKWSFVNFFKGSFFMNKAVMMNTAIEITKAAAQGGHTQPWNVLKEVYAALKEINQNATRDDGDNS